MLKEVQEQISQPLGSSPSLMTFLQDALCGTTALSRTK